ncbi:MAG: SDR family oxidoreductase [Candidatus Zixiibacteriota bacterium]
MKTPKRILVTGAGGMLGVRLLPHLKRVFKKACIFSVFHHAEPASQVFETTALGDLTDSEFFRQIVELSAPGLVINLASLTDVERCEREPEYSRRVNAGLVANLIQSAPEAHLVQLSTDYVFDGRSGKYTETDRPGPLSVYGKTKLESETLTLQNEQHLLIRTSGTFDWLNQKNFFGFVINRLSEGKDVRALVDCYYSPICADDLARGIIGLLKRTATGLVHFGGPERVTRYDFALKIAEEFGYDETLIHPASQADFGWRATRPADSSLNSAAGYRAADVTPRSLNNTLSLMREQMEASVGDTQRRSKA